MRIKKCFTKCLYCNDLFRPHPRLKDRQKTCGKKDCKKKHRAAHQRKYRALNKVETVEYESKRKDNRGKNYWKDWRASHPDYVERNRKQSILRKKLKKRGLQRKLDILQVVEKKDEIAVFSEFATKERSLIQDCYVREAA